MLSSLLAVSKTFPAAAVREAFQAGQIAFGESYVQEALAKIAALRDLPLEWHFIGPLQSNKTRQVAEHFAWVHSVDRAKIAERLSAARPDSAAATGLPASQCQRRSQQKWRCTRRKLAALAAHVRSPAAPATARPDGDSRARRMMWLCNGSSSDCVSELLAQV